ncbi:hypothetical protein [Moheibacter sediminis]|uniref:DNA-directed DNA polymerase family A palm domain-containing protein n=1 Tax=Moheibacter sediminis TaxID=1434700 RepID=A0A1W1YBQ9_9FLAO|nr:hypothetical protein [Moheibacter sediminis]SMC33586.1 hypothetical protein SAMN06296427_101231 [Moheibacter sediminis]
MLEVVPKRFPLYIPENLNIDELVKSNPPQFKFHKDELAYIVHLINDIPSRNKSEDEGMYYYVPLYSVLLQRRVRDYRKYLDYLVANGIFDEDKRYVQGKKSRSFKFTDEYQTPIRQIYITKYTLIKSLLKYINVDLSNEKCLIEDERNLDYLQKWFSGNLTIDFSGAVNELWRLYEIDKRDRLKILLIKGKLINPIQRFNSRYLPVFKLHRLQFLNVKDRTAGRYHTVLTQIMGSLRQFIRFNNQKLVAVDIVNSQPYLSCVLFDKQKFRDNTILPKIRLYNNYLDNKIEVRKKLCSKVENSHRFENVNQFIDIVKSGRLYEEFGELLLKKDIIVDDGNVRAQVKKIVFSSFFSPNQSIAYNEAIKVFKDSFPDVYEIYRVIKQSKHRTLACVLQNLEAELVLHKACKIISEQRPEIPLFTLHDAIITTEGNEKFVKQVLYDVLLNAIGIPPTLKFERWEQAA